MDKLEIGIVVEVKGFINKIATFENTNHSTFIYKGTLINNVIVNGFIIIQQKNVKIIAKINSETIWDKQNNSNDFKLDNRFSKKTIKRVLEVQTIGYIFKGRFYTGASFLPMIGNIASIPTNEETNQIYINNYSENHSKLSIGIGESLIEKNEIQLPVDLFFASHIGIFGNTGSGKSNTLLKMYYELFNKTNSPKLKENSKFFVMDFNGEYIQDNSFGVKNTSDKTMYDLNTSNTSEDLKLQKKFPISENVFFNEDILAVLFSATPQTQKPFLHRVISKQKRYSRGSISLSRWLNSLIKQLFSKVADKDLKNLLIQTLEDSYEGIGDLLENIKKTETFQNGGELIFICKSSGRTVYFDGKIEHKHVIALDLERIEQFVSAYDLSPLQELLLRCKLQLLNDLIYRNVQEDFITPLIRRIEQNINDLEKVIEIKDRIESESFLNIISLRNANSNVKKILPLLIARMLFSNHKLENKNKNNSFHLIIDEAHNILSSQTGIEKDSWRDYRLELFEEIIKEGRKFSFFLTIASQRPADISQTILSQIHNYFIHKLVNERDLQIIDNSISTLDKMSKSMIPVLSTGVCIISGSALSIPITVSIDNVSDKTMRPDSDTIVLSDIWT